MTTRDATPEETFRQELSKITGWPDDGRKILVTPFLGAYGVAGWVIAREGSPPRGIVFVVDGNPGRAIVFDAWGRVKSFPLNDERYQRHRAFIRSLLAFLAEAQARIAERG